eukprot:9853887-Prorocentrum_lima.AAC.1
MRVHWVHDLVNANLLGVQYLASRDSAHTQTEGFFSVRAGAMNQINKKGNVFHTGFESLTRA